MTKTKLYFLNLIILIILFGSTTFAQKSGLPPDQAVQIFDYSCSPEGANFDCLVPCGQGDTISILIAAPKEDEITNIVIEPKIPDHMEWNGYLATPNGGTAIIVNSDPLKPTFSINPLGPGNSSVVLEYGLRLASCYYIKDEIDIIVSSTNFGSNASEVYDGSFATSSNWQSVYEIEPWWQIDLGYLETITEVRIFNPSGEDADPASNYGDARKEGGYLLISSSPFPSGNLSTLLADPNITSFYNPFDAIVGDTDIINTGSVNGQYVRYMLEDSALNPGFARRLYLTELEIDLEAIPPVPETDLGDICQNIYFTYCGEDYTETIPIDLDLNNIIAFPSIGVNCTSNTTFNTIGERKTYGPITITNNGDPCAYLQNLNVIIDFEDNDGTDYVMNELRINGIVVPASDYTFNPVTNTFTFTIDGNTYYYDNSSEVVDNNLMEFGEEVQIEMDFTLVGCPQGNQNAFIQVSYGCDDVCQSVDCNDSGLKTNLDFQFDLIHSMTLIDPDFSEVDICNDNRFDFSISTTATPNTSPQADFYNLQELVVELPRCFDTMYLMNEITIGGNAIASTFWTVNEDVPSMSNPTDSVDLLVINIQNINTDIDGAGGLDDLNGDGMYNDIPAGNTVNGSIFFGLSCPMFHECPININTSTSCDWTASEYRIGSGIKDCGEPYSETGTYTPPSVNSSVEFLVEIEDVLNNVDDTPGPDNLWDDLFVDVTDPNVNTPFTVYLDYAVNTTNIDLSGCTTGRYFYEVFFGKMTYDVFNTLAYIPNSTSFDGNPVSDANVTFTKDPVNNTALMIIEAGDDLTNIPLRRYQFDLELTDCGNDDMESLMSHRVYETCDDSACCDTIVKACASQMLHVDKVGCGGSTSTWEWHTETYRHNYDPDGSGDPIPIDDRRRAMMYDTMEVTVKIYDKYFFANEDNPFIFDQLGFRFNFLPGNMEEEIWETDVLCDGFEDTDPALAAFHSGSCSFGSARIHQMLYSTMNHKLRAVTDNIQASFYDATSGTWTPMDCTNLITFDSLWYQGLENNTTGIYQPNGNSSSFLSGLQEPAYSAISGIPDTAFYGYNFYADMSDCMQALSNKLLYKLDTFQVKFLFEILPNPNPAIGCDEINSDTTGWNQLYFTTQDENLKPNRTEYSGPMGLMSGQTPDPDYINYPLWHKLDFESDNEQEHINDTHLEVACNRMYFEQKHTVDNCQADVEVKMMPGLQMNDGKIIGNPSDISNQNLDIVNLTSYQGNGAPSHDPLDDWFSAERRNNLRVDSLFVTLPTGAIYTAGTGKLCYLDANETTILEVPLEPITVNTVPLQAGNTTYQLADANADWHLLVDLSSTYDLFVGDDYPLYFTYKYSYETVCPIPGVADTYKVYLEQTACNDYHYQTEYFGENESNIQNGNPGDQLITLFTFEPMTNTPTSASTTTNLGTTHGVEFDICNTGTAGTNSDYDFTGSLVTIPAGVSLIDITPRGGGTPYTYSLHQNNADGSVVYYFDNPSTSIAAGACWEYDVTVSLDYCLLEEYTYPITSEAFASCIPAADFKDLPSGNKADCVFATSTHDLNLGGDPCRTTYTLQPSGSPVDLCSDMELIFLTGNNCGGGTRNNEFIVWLPQGVSFTGAGLEYDITGSFNPGSFSATGNIASPPIDPTRSGGGFTAYTVTWEGDLGQTDPFPGSTFSAFKLNIATTCDFINGLPVKFESTGLDDCNNMVSSGIATDVITVNGAEFEDLVKITSEFHSIEGATCGNFDFCFNGVIIPRVEAAISTCVFVTIPQEITYDSITWVTPSTAPGPVIQTTDPAGNTVLQITSPTATTAYATYGFYVHTQISTALTCQELPFSYYTVGKVSLACPADPNSPCEISAVLDGASFMLPIKPKVDITEAQVNFTCSGDPNNMSYEVVAKNISLDTLSNIPYDLNAYADADGNGILDASIDVLIANTTGTIAGPFYPADNISIEGTFSVPLFQACNVLLEFKPNTGCSCDSISVKPEMGFDLGLPIVNGKINACDPISFEVCDAVNFSVEPASVANISQAGSTVTITMNAANFGADPIALTLTSQFGECQEITQTFEMGCCPAVTLDAGSYAEELCTDGLDLSLLAASSTASTTLWQSSGDGSFNDTGGTMGVFGTATSYIPGPNDLASGTFTLSLVSPPVGCCEGASDEVTVEVGNCCGPKKCLPIKVTIRRGTRN